MKLITLMSAGLIAFAMAGFTSQNPIDDSDISGGAVLGLQVAPDSVLQPDRIVELKDVPGSEVELQFLYQRNGEWLPIEGLNVSLGNLKLATQTDDNGKISGAAVCGKEQVSIRAPLKTTKFSIQGSWKEYELQFSVPCGKSLLVQFDEASTVGQAISIFETIRRAERMLGEAVGLDYWQRSLTVNWPADGDYYNWGTVNITLGHQWDVVGHELGHAIYDMGDLGQFGGGAHKIDECYSQSLALSEGWATFFAGWLYLDLNDEDAKFQYLVPRRAPIQIENIPTDVCRGENNEWRVSGFFWDVIDLHDDKEGVNEAFALTWSALRNSRVSGARQAAEKLKSSGIAAEKVQAAWNNAF